MSRALSPVIGIPLLVGITVVLSATIGIVTIGIPALDAPQTPVVVSVTATADTNQITLVNDGGRTVDVRDITLQLAIDEVPLRYQPPVPFFAAKGYRSGPTGAFNSATDPMWEPGERVSIRLASTNTPSLSTNAKLTVRITIDDTPIASVETRAS